MGALFLLAALAPEVSAQVPRRQIPPAVLAELTRLESRFELALYADCDAERCFSRGCTYVDHAVIDQPRSTSMPGFGLDPGPGSVASQEFLTQATCSFAHEPSEDASDIQALVRRLQARTSSGWTVVSVDNQALQPIPDYLREPPSADNIPEPELELEEIVEAEPDEWLTMAIAGRELWHTLLPHFFWMVAIGLLSFAGMVMIWAWRRVGRDSLEEQLMLAQMTEGDVEPEEGADAVVGEVPDDVSDFVAQQDAAWRTRLADMAGDGPDEPELEALIHELLRSGDMALLAKAVLTFPKHFPAAFPSGGEVASAKLDLADYLKTVDVSTLPADDVFFESLNRHALSAALTTQSDARIVRSLREDFGAAGLVAFIADLPARPGALLFALSPVEKQHEMVQLFTPYQAADLAEELLRSDRMDPVEADYIFEVLRAARGDTPLPPAPNAGAVLDRGMAIDAAGALSILLPRLPAEGRTALFDAALRRLNGSLPDWYRGIFTADMLLTLSAESRADLLLEVDVETLAAWMSIQDAETRSDLLAGLPNSLRASVESVAGFASRAQQLDLAGEGRDALSRSFQRHLSRSGVAFEDVVRPGALL
ncbi:MAG: hypothetical protein ACI8RZ_001966 [Myxococcota bacterium]|jgi:hypothetical protein